MEKLEPLRKPTFNCNGWTTIIGPQNAYSIMWSCKMLRCDRCRPEVIDEKKEILKQNIEGPEVCLIKKILSKKSLSNWIQKHRREVTFYMAIKTPDEALIISNVEFRGAPETQRMDKTKFCEDYLPQYINDNFMKGMRIDCSRGTRRGPKKGDKPANKGNLARIPGEIRDEYNSLKTLSEKADRLYKPDVQIWTPGEKFRSIYKTNHGWGELKLPVLEITASSHQEEDASGAD